MQERMDTVDSNFIGSTGNTQQTSLFRTPGKANATKLNSNLTSIKKRGYHAATAKKSTKKLGISVFDKEMTINRGLVTLTALQSNANAIKEADDDPS